MKLWYALQTKPKAEYQVVENLQLHELVVYLPEIKVRQAGKAVESQPFFPSYLFVEADLGVTNLTTIQWTPGLLRLISFGDEPAPVPAEVIDLIQAKLEEINDGGGPPAHNFKPGDTVRITEGPFQDMLAIFDRSTAADDRVRVLLEILGRASRVEVDPATLKKVTDAPGEPAPTRPKRPRRTRGRGRPIRPKD